MNDFMYFKDFLYLFVLSFFSPGLFILCCVYTGIRDLFIYLFIFWKEKEHRCELRRGHFTLTCVHQWPRDLWRICPSPAKNPGGSARAATRGGDLTPQESSYWKFSPCPVCSSSINKHFFTTSRHTKGAQEVITQLFNLIFLKRVLIERLTS